MISNINYKGVVRVPLDRFKFSSTKPYQYIEKNKQYTILIFKSGACRIMGCRVPLKNNQLPYNIVLNCIQSISLYTDYGREINLYQLSKKAKSLYEPELFPALRLLAFKPLCVNIFNSGKITILGIRTLNFQKIINNIINYLKQCECELTGRDSTLSINSFI